MKAKRVVVTHVRNEEYLLKWWIPHHKEKFDFGVVIDYGSTDESMELFRKHVPHWQILQSSNKDFNAVNCDMEVRHIEAQIFNALPRSYVIALNSTEFLIGDTSKLEVIHMRSQKLIPCDSMVDPISLEGVEPNSNVSLIRQRFHGVPLAYENCRFNPHKSPMDVEYERRKLVDPVFAKNVVYCNRWMRSLHNYSNNYLETSMYGAGRHYWGTPCEDFRILWYGFSPYTDNLVNRQKAIQTQIPEKDRLAGNGGQHIIDDEKSKHRLRFYQEFAIDMSDIISRYEDLTQ